MRRQRRPYRVAPRTIARGPMSIRGSGRSRTPADRLRSRCNTSIPLREGTTRPQSPRPWFHRGAQDRSGAVPAEVESAPVGGGRRRSDRHHGSARRSRRHWRRWRMRSQNRQRQSAARPPAAIDSLAPRIPAHRPPASAWHAQASRWHGPSHREKADGALARKRSELREHIGQLANEHDEHARVP